MKAGHHTRSCLVITKYISLCPVTKVCVVPSHTVLPLSSGGQVRALVKNTPDQEIERCPKPGTELLIGSL